MHGHVRKFASAINSCVNYLMPEKCGLSPQDTHGKGIVGGLHAALHRMVAILPLLAGTDASCWCVSGLDVPIIWVLVACVCGVLRLPRTGDL